MAEKKDLLVIPSIQMCYLAIIQEMSEYSTIATVAVGYLAEIIFYFS